VPLFISLRNIETHKINNMILTSRVICERIIEENLQAQLFVSSDKGTSTQTFQGISIISLFFRFCFHNPSEYTFQNIIVLASSNILPISGNII
jgi:hypothetical protein